MKKLFAVLMFLILGLSLNLSPAAADPLGIEIPKLVTSENIQTWANDACPDAKYDSCNDEVANCMTQLQNDLINKASGWCFKKGSDTWACQDDSYSSLEGYVTWVKSHPKENPATEAVQECNEFILTGVYLKPNYNIFLNLAKLSCGNSQFDEGEECEDGNLEDKDGCSAACKLETDPTGELTVTPNLIDERSNLACTVLLEGKESLAKPECDEAYKACIQEARHLWWEGLKNQCGNKILTGPYGPDYRYYCTYSEIENIHSQTLGVVTSFKDFFKNTCNTQSVPPGNDDEGNNGGGTVQPPPVLGGNNGVSGGSDSGDPSKPGVNPGVNLAGGACSLMVTTQTPGAAMSLIIAALFTLPLLRRNK